MLPVHDNRHGVEKFYMKEIFQQKYSVLKAYKGNTLFTINNTD